MALFVVGREYSVYIQVLCNALYVYLGVHNASIIYYIYIYYIVYILHTVYRQYNIQNNTL